MIKRTRDEGRRVKYEAELALPPFPMALDYLWRAFRRLARRRTSNGFSSNPITWPDIDAFVRHSKFPLTPWEVEIIEDLDDIERVEQGRVRQPENSGGKENDR